MSETREEASSRLRKAALARWAKPGARKPKPKPRVYQLNTSPEERKILARQAAQVRWLREGQIDTDAINTLLRKARKSRGSADNAFWERRKAMAAKRGGE